MQTTPASNIDERLTRLETTLELFMEEQRSWRAQFVEDQRSWRTQPVEEQRSWQSQFVEEQRSWRTQFMEEEREWRAQFVEEQREWRAKFTEDQREWRREFNATLNRMEARIDKLDANINRLYFATFSVVGALAVAVIAASIFS